MNSSPIRWDPHNARPPRAERPRDPGHRPEDNLFLSLSPERARVLLIVAARATSFTVVVIVALVVATLLAADSAMTGASGAIAAGWLAIHQVPLVIGKTTLSLLPLVPTGLVLWLAARDCARAVEPDSTRADLGWIVGAALSGPLLVTAVCLAVADDASAVVALQPPQALAAFACVGGLHLLAALAGIASRRSPLRDRLVVQFPIWVEPAARAALRVIQRLMLGGVILLLLSFLMHLSRIGDTYRAAGNLGGVLGLTLLSLAYLPNTVVGATSVLIGADVHIGGGGLSVFSVAGAPVPALPVLAGVPEGPAATWWPVVLLVPAVVGVLAGMDCARGSDDQPRRPWATLTAAGLTALTMALFAGLSGGAVGSFGDIGPSVLALAGLSFAWVAIPGYVGLLCARWFLPTSATRLAGSRYAEGYPDDDEFDGDYADGDYADDDYERSDYERSDYERSDYERSDYGYDDLDYVEYDPMGSDRIVEVDGELVEEQVALGPAGEFDEILDAEVVEADLPDTGKVDGS